MKTSTLFSLLFIISLAFCLNLVQARKLLQEDPKIKIGLNHRPIWFPPWLRPGISRHFLPPPWILRYPPWLGYPFPPFPWKNPSPKPEPPTSPSPVPPFSWPEPDGSSGPNAPDPSPYAPDDDEITQMLQDWFKEIQQWWAHPVGPFPIPPWMKPQTAGWFPHRPWMRPYIPGHFPISPWLKPPAGH
ncbi:OLC1v1029903C1 [Oldenlandia corymbosa var. corymbosa]|uniref:OLC1v1029903C1 n=1 Tax=Oldenlandia corymbosa var. corymbosa TaxID=529605 RepID=A0AAV1CHX8_OLDCO|nr:OLC1v1029903C1 [Oldenlandia corymbosa var. corymbosa]